MDGLPGKCSSASSASCAVCDPCRTGSCGPRPCRNAVDLDLPVIADEIRSVRRHDLNLVSVVSELGRRGHSAIGSMLEYGVMTLFAVYRIGREKASFLDLFAFRHPSRNRGRELLCGPSIPKPCALQDLESHASLLGLQKLSSF